jgi:hypothetical protein
VGVSAGNQPISGAKCLLKGLVLHGSVSWEPVTPAPPGLSPHVLGSVAQRGDPGL